MNRIFIDRLQVFCNHGVYEEETKNGQNFYVSAEIELNCFQAGVTDNLEDSVDYAALCKGITEFMKSHTFRLLEALSEQLSRYILSFHPIIQSVSLKIEKPEAPIGLPFSNVGVSIQRSWHQAFIAYGSNMGDKLQHIDFALLQMAQDSGIKIIKRSSTIKTKPYGGVKQDDFLNGCVQIRTWYSPEELLNVLQTIEKKAGRTKTVHWGPRTLDLDLLLYDEQTVHTDALNVPHIDMQNRAFVLKPLCEIAPNAFHPVLRKTAQELLDALESL